MGGIFLPLSSKRVFDLCRDERSGRSSHHFVALASNALGGIGDLEVAERAIV